MNNPAIPAMGKLDMRIWLDTGFCSLKMSQVNGTVTSLLLLHQVRQIPAVASVWTDARLMISRAFIVPQ
jgi:hypothetical protein